MKRFFPLLRITLLTFALGVAGVQFISAVINKWNNVPVDLPKVESEELLYIFPSAPLKPYSPVRFSEEDIIQDRDLSAYGKRIKFSDCYHEFPKVRKCNEQAKKARQLIIKNWKQKKRSYFVYGWSTCDAGGDIYGFIEPDQNGNWRVVIRWIPGSGVYYNGRDDTLEEMIATSIKYKRAKSDDYEYRLGTYLLRLENNKEKFDF